MSFVERRRRALLLAKAYPVKIQTSAGKFLMPVRYYQLDSKGVKINQRTTYARFDTLADAIEAVCCWRESHRG